MENVQGVSSQVLSILRRITRAIDVNSKNLVRTYGLTGPQLVLLHELREGQKITVGDLAKKVNLSNATVTDILDRMENKGLVQRIRNDTDRRRVMVSITDKGLLLAQDAPFILQKNFYLEFEKLQDWEQTLILSSLQRIAAMLEQSALECSPLQTSENIFMPCTGSFTKDS
jgi:DNA-binding MarR family transcriptional regulator